MASRAHCAVNSQNGQFCGTAEDNIKQSNDSHRKRTNVYRQEFQFQLEPQ